MWSTHEAIVLDGLTRSRIWNSFNIDGSNEFHIIHHEIYRHKPTHWSCFHHLFRLRRLNLVFPIHFLVIDPISQRSDLSQISSPSRPSNLSHISMICYTFFITVTVFSSHSTISSMFDISTSSAFRVFVVEKRMIVFMSVAMAGSASSWEIWYSMWPLFWVHCFGDYMEKSTMQSLVALSSANRSRWRWHRCGAKNWTNGRQTRVDTMCNGVIGFTVFALTFAQFSTKNVTIGQRDGSVVMSRRIFPAMSFVFTSTFCCNRRCAIEVDRCPSRIVFIHSLPVFFRGLSLWQKSSAAPCPPIGCQGINKILPWDNIIRIIYSNIVIENDKIHSTHRNP